MRLNYPVVLFANGQVHEVGRIDVGPDWTFNGWISTSIAVELDLEKNLESLALNPTDEYIAKVTTAAIVETSEKYSHEKTMAKVREALASVVDPVCGYGQIDDIINTLQNAGILFRERNQ